MPQMPPWLCAWFKLMYVVCPEKMLVDIDPKIRGASCVADLQLLVAD